MKKIIMLMYIVSLSVVLYQLVLGKNGIIEGYRLKKERDALDRYILYLKSDIGKLKEYADYLNSAPDARTELANQMGFFGDAVELYKFKKTKQGSGSSIAESNVYLREYIDASIEVEKLIALRTQVSVVFYIVIALFVVMIVFGPDQKE